jgi:hypothetical protein
MKTPACSVLAVAAALPLCSSALAQQWSDDFNRPNGPIGAHWIPIPGTADYQVIDNRGRHLTTGTTYLQHATASAHYADVTCYLDVFCPNTASQNSKIMIGMGGNMSIEVKIQNQVSTTPGFSHYAFYRVIGTSAAGWTGTGAAAFAALTAPFESGRMKVYFSDPDTIVLEVDTDFNGIPDQIYTRTGVLSIASELGTGLGTGAWNNQAEFDNWLVVVNGGGGCYANCDGSTTPPILNVEDFSCFINEFAAAQGLPSGQQVTHYANCDESTTAPVLNVEDFSCFINKFAQGCP